MRGQYLTAAGAVAAAAPPEASAVANVTSLKSRPDQVVGYHRTILLRCCLLLMAVTAAHYALLPLWALFLVSVSLYPAIYLRLHDIGHGASVKDYGFFARFLPTGNPIWGGTRVFALVHREHHKLLGTDRDPWLPYYTGHPLRALFFNFIEPEYSCAQFIRMYGIDAELVANGLFNLGCIGAGLLLLPGTFALHLLSLRVVHAVGIFFFNFYAHRETLSGDAAIGTWEREADLKVWLPLFRLIWTSDVVDGLIYHNRHHCLGQQHIPVQNYKHLSDTGLYTHFNDQWPITKIIAMPTEQGERAACARRKAAKAS